MLVLTRKLGDSVSINNGEVLIRVVQIKGKQIRLGVICDKSIPIDRVDQDGNVEKWPNRPDGNK